MANHGLALLGLYIQWLPGKASPDEEIWQISQDARGKGFCFRLVVEKSPSEPTAFPGDQ